MKIEQLAIKQKRLNYLQGLVDNHEIHDEAVKIALIDCLKVYRNLLASCWEAKEITAADEVQISDLDRQLRALHEESRVKLTVN